MGKETKKINGKGYANKHLTTRTTSNSKQNEIKIALRKVAFSVTVKWSRSSQTHTPARPNRIRYKNHISEDSESCGNKDWMDSNYRKRKIVPKGLDNCQPFVYLGAGFGSGLVRVKGFCLGTEVSNLLVVASCRSDKLKH